MNKVENPSDKSSIGILGSLATGFELAADSYFLLLIPLFLDILIWLSPRLDYNPLISNMIDQYSALNSFMELSGDEDSINLINQYQTMLDEIDGQFPLVHIPVFGMPSMLAGSTAGDYPFTNTPMAIQVESSQDLFSIILIAITASVIIVSLYLSLIGNRVNHTHVKPGKLLLNIPVKALQLSGFVALVVITAMLIFAPFFLLSSLFSTIGGVFSLLGLAILAFGCVILTWMFIGLGFTLQGFFMNNKNIYQAMLDSLRLVQWRSFPSMMILLVVLTLNWAFNRFIWPLAGNNGVLLLAAVIGHAFITTGSVIGTFVFFRDQYAEWEKYRKDMSNTTLSAVS